MIAQKGNIMYYIKIYGYKIVELQSSHYIMPQLGAKEKNEAKVKMTYYGS